MELWVGNFVQNENGKFVILDNLECDFMGEFYLHKEIYFSY